MRKGTRGDKRKRGGGAITPFFNYGMPHDFKAAERVERRTRAEQLAELRRMQETRPLKPPPTDFGPRRSQAAEKDAAKYNTTQITPEISHVGVGIYYGGRGRDG